MTQSSKPGLRTAQERATDLHIGQRVKALRASQAIPVYKLAAAADIAELELAKYETGIRRMSPHALLALAKALGVPVGELFEGL
jgi:transcriptional regulator with XRE-family HTH domain